MPASFRMEFCLALPKLIKRFAENWWKKIVWRRLSPCLPVVFKPYAGVSTAILIFTKTGHGGTDKVWFYDMKADGFSLDDKRNPINENDIPDIIERFRNRDQETERNGRSSLTLWKNRISLTMSMTFPLTSIKKWNIYR